MKEEREGRVSLKQLVVLTFCGLLSPLTRVIPSQTGGLAGAGGWLGPLIALPAFLLALWLMDGSMRRLPRGAGLGGLYRIGFGPVAGRAASLVTFLWLLVTAAVSLRFCAEGFVSSIYSGTGIWMFLLALIAVVWWVSAHGAAAVCRMGQVFFYILCITVGVVLVFALPGVRLYHIWPVWLEGWDSVLLSALPVLSILGYSVPVLFYRGTLGESRGGFAMAAAWFTALCVVISLMGLVIIGTFGWQMAVRFQLPFFSLAKEVTLLSIVERLESVVTALWVFSDIALLGAFLLAATEQAQAITSSFGRRGVIIMGCVLTVLLAAFLGSSTLQLHAIWKKWMVLSDSIVCYLLPLAGCLAVRLRRRV